MHRRIKMVEHKAEQDYHEGRISKKQFAAWRKHFIKTGEDIDVTTGKKLKPQQGASLEGSGMPMGR